MAEELTTEEVKELMGKGWRLYRITSDGKLTGRLRKQGEKDRYLGPWSDDLEEVFREQEPGRRGRPATGAGAQRRPSPEASAKMGALSELAVETGKEAVYRMRRRLVSGMAVERLSRAAEARGFASVEDYIGWLHRRSMVRPPGGATAWESFKDFAHSLVVADALGVEVDPRMIPVAYMITKIESKKGGW